MRRIAAIYLICFALCRPWIAAARAEEGNAFDAWMEMVTRTQAEQPHWITPLVTVTPRLEQEYRFDAIEQDEPNDRSTTVYGAGKGLELIPLERIELILGVPPQVERNQQRPDGAGDVSFLLKYRLLTANEHAGNYIFTLFFGATAPTGDAGVGAEHATFTPTIAGGKGWGPIDVQATLGATIPNGDVDRLGTPLLFNAALQYVLWERLWPEMEINLTSWPNGDRNGKTQVFLTPGIVCGRFPVWKRVGFTIGAGVQIAASSFRTANRNWILSARLPF